jgi:hypothetical protein
MILTHKKTKQRLLFKTSNSLVSTLYVLDNEDNKVFETNELGRTPLDVNGNKRYKMAICLNDNLVKVNITEVKIKDMNDVDLSGQRYYYATLDWGFKKIRTAFNTDGFFNPHMNMDEWLEYLETIPSNCEIENIK